MRVLFAIFAVLLTFWLGPTALALYTDWLWFADLGFAEVYRTRLLTQVALFLLGGAASLALLMGSAALARRLSDRVTGHLEFPRSAQIRAMERPFRIAVLAGAGFVSLLMAATLAAQWQDVLRFLHATDFGVADPLSHRDVGFFVFTLPLHRFLQGWLSWAVALALMAGAAVYLFKIVLPRTPRTTAYGEIALPSPATVAGLLSRPMRAHVFGLAAALFVLVAWGHRLSIYELAYSPHGAAFGAGFTDVHARLPALWWMVCLSLLLAVVLGVAAALRRPPMRLVLYTGGLWAAAWVLALGLVPSLVQRVIVEPQELERERPYIERTIQMTRRAFALDRITEIPIAGGGAVTADEIGRSPGTVDNIRLWDPEPLLATFNQIQSIRMYYEFTAVDVDRYTIGGRYRQVMLAARELAPERLPAEAQTWVNRRLQFTHGFGVAMAAVNEVTPEGLPVLLVQDVPPRGQIRIDRPEIYFGERPSDYVIVRTRFPEFSYPKGEENVFKTYQGTTGVRIGSRWRRLLFAWRFGDMNILLSDAITRESVILYHRSVGERVARLAPFLRLDRDPYLVIADGRLFWILDAYTHTDRFPYAQRHRDGFNYLRNSVKAVVDAYHGTVTLYVSDPTDPIVRAYAGIFPGVFRPLTEMSPALRPHLRYPQDLFAAQAEMYSVFHMQDPRVFYNREDVWTLPEEIYIDAPRTMVPYYVIMRLPGEPTEEFVLIIPFTPPGKQNMITWLAARSDGERYGELVAFRYPKDQLVFGPMQIEARLNQDPVISEQFTLWSQAGNRVIRGKMVVIPIGQSNLYVEPIYLQAEQGRLPEMRRVILASGDRIVMEPTVGAALERLFADPASARPEAGRVPAPAEGRAVGPDTSALLESLRARQARIQEEMRALESDLRRLLQMLDPAHQR